MSCFARAPLALALSLGLAAAAQAGVTFRFDRPQASPGQQVFVEATFFNDGNAVANWQTPRELVLQWRNAQGVLIRTLAKVDRKDSTPLEIPVGNFVRTRWAAEVPSQAEGVQTVTVEGEPVLLALDTRPGNVAAAVAPAPAPLVDPRTGTVLPASAVPPLGESPITPLSNNSDFETATLQRFRSAVSSYEPVYFSLGTASDTTARFQISLKYRLFQPADDKNPRFVDNLYFGYTQTSLWDLGADSAPFRDSSYKPAFFWLSDRVWESENRRWSLGTEAGFQHESNGKDGADSRSLNNFYAQPLLRYRLDQGSTLSFGPKLRTYMSLENNPDIREYRGNVDWLVKWTQDDGMMLSALARKGNSKGSVQVDFAYPLRTEWLSNLNGYLHLQVFRGYGETLLEYNKRAETQARIGLMIVR
ncbi:phospholipase [Pigmentiphaga aceris]|uniref:Phospholipase A1 n=1 Tax=Pigmentiphaga aceris TaxID=1940612 RepID=A0A5C0B5I8_9BURK|nr:phospholipase [Pigmentiphaga aceris]